MQASFSLQFQLGSGSTLRLLPSRPPTDLRGSFGFSARTPAPQPNAAIGDIRPEHRRLRFTQNKLPRKEVIQPHLPVQLPCYDFVPVIGPTLGACVPKVSPATSSITNFHDVTGGVYKARERIQRSVLTCVY